MEPSHPLYSAVEMLYLHREGWREGGGREQVVIHVTGSMLGQSSVDIST